MQKRIIKSAISLSLVGAMLIGLCSCNSSPVKIQNTDVEEKMPSVTETAVQAQNLSLSAVSKQYVHVVRKILHRQEEIFLIMMKSFSSVRKSMRKIYFPHLKKRKVLQKV